MNLELIYLVLGTLTFWTGLTVAILFGSVYIAEAWRDRTYRREIGNVLDPLTKAQTDRLVRQWRS